jgi:hypothetical protein
MKAVWCDALNGSWPAWDKFRKYGLARIYVSALETKKDGTSRLKELVDGIHSQGFEAGLYRDPHWTGLSAKDLAATAHTDLLSAGAKYRAQQCAYLFDTEYHDPGYLLDLISAWKALRPTREWAWTLEPFQGGWFTKELVDRVNSDDFCTVIPQTYLGGMEPCSELAVISDLVTNRNFVWNYGVAPTQIASFYDGIRGAPERMDGIIFTDGRLP